MADSLSEVFGRTKFNKKRIKINIYFFTEKIYLDLKVNFLVLSYVRIRHFLCQIYSLLTQYYKIYPKIVINFLSKKKIFLDPILCNFVRPKTSDKVHPWSCNE